jgi:hypothetical protein
MVAIHHRALSYKVVQVPHCLAYNGIEGLPPTLPNPSIHYLWEGLLTLFLCRLSAKSGIEGSKGLRGTVLIHQGT